MTDAVVIIISLSVLTALLIMIGLVGHGWANSLDWLALIMHRHATACRKRHARRTAVVSEQWVRQLELDGTVDNMPDELPAPEPEPEPLDLVPFSGLQAGKYRHFGG